MKDFSFIVPQNITFGAGSVKKLPEMVKELKVSNVLVISGPHLNKMGVTDKITALIEETGAKTCKFTEVEANPSVETVHKAADAYKENQAEAIVAIGGGSPMDVAKAVGVIVTYGGSITEYEGGGKVPGEIVPFIAIPTTAGTGSEVTAFSVITDHSRNYKLTVASQKLLPSHVILDPEFLTSCPAGTAAASGVDAMVHAIESYINKDCNPFIEAMAEKALELLGENIRKFVADRTNIEAASAMLLGSTFAGIAFNFGRLGDVHAMAHPVGGFFNVAHGMANAILLPVCLEYNALADDGKYKKIYDYISYTKADDSFVPEMLVEEVRKLTKSLGIPETLSEVGVTEDKISQMAEDAMKSGNIAVNPRITTKKDVEMLYKKAM